METSNSMRPKCPTCIDSITVTDAARGEEVCSRCGFVLSQRAEELGMAYHASDDAGDVVRHGLPTSLAIHDMGLATLIGQTGKDATGKPLSGTMKSTIERLRILDNRIHIRDHSERNFRQAFSDLDKLRDKLALPDAIVERAAYIYRKVVERRLVIGRSIHVMIAASLYAACRNSDTPRTLHEIAAASDRKRKELSRCYRIILDQFDFKMPPPDPMKCVVKIARAAGLNEKICRMALQILGEATAREISAGKEPMGFAASALYLSCVINNEKKATQRVIAKAANVTEVTIRNRYKQIYLMLESRNGKVLR